MPRTPRAPASAASRRSTRPTADAAAVVDVITAPAAPLQLAVESSTATIPQPVQSAPTHSARLLPIIIAALITVVALLMYGHLQPSPEARAAIDESAPLAVPNLAMESALSVATPVATESTSATEEVASPAPPVQTTNSPIVATTLLEIESPLTHDSAPLSTVAIAETVSTETTAPVATIPHLPIVSNLEATLPPPINDSTVSMTEAESPPVAERSTIDELDAQSLSIHHAASNVANAGKVSAPSPDTPVTPPSITLASDALMAPKAHGTCTAPVQSHLRFGVDSRIADRISCFNRHAAEWRGYFRTTEFVNAVQESAGAPVTFYDSVSGRPLFIAPRGRSLADFVQESIAHGWPSFRAAEIVHENVRVLADGEVVSVDGTHLGHNLPDHRGARFCINIVSCAGSPSVV